MNDFSSADLFSRNIKKSEKNKQKSINRIQTEGEK